MTPPLEGSCFCGSVSYRLSERPILSAYCHCTNCQRLTACPFVHTVHFRSDAFSWSHEQPHDLKLDKYVIPSKPWKTRWRCKSCGACIAGSNSKTGNWSIWAAQLRRDEHSQIKGWDVVKPTAHIFYGTRLLDVNDDLGKWEGYEQESSQL